MEHEETYKYICEQCDFKCNAPSVWKIHTETEKHKTLYLLKIKWKKKTINEVMEQLFKNQN